MNTHYNCGHRPRAAGCGREQADPCPLGEALVLVGDPVAAAHRGVRGGTAGRADDACARAAAVAGGLRAELVGGALGVAGAAAATGVCVCMCARTEIGA